MRKSKAISRFLAIALFSSMVLTGCGGEKPSSGASASADTKGAQPAEAPKSTKLVVYTALNEDDILALQKKFKEDTGIDIAYIRLGGGDAVARVQAEKDSPKADVLVGGSVDLYEPLAKEGIFEKYSSPNAKDLDAKFNDPNGFWQGWYMGVQGIVINKDRFEKELASKGLQKPQTWDDLLDERYKNVFVNSNPATSGGAYIFAADQIFRLGEDKAWEYLINLDKNVHHYYKGAGDCISPIATGEFIAGVSWVHDIFKTQKQGYPIEIIIPKQTAFEIGGAAVIKGGPNTENAKKFVDWLLTKEIGELNTKLSNRYSVRSDVAAPEGLPKIEDIDLVQYDRAKAGEMKPAVVEKFEKEIISKRN